MQRRTHRTHRLRQVGFVQKEAAKWDKQQQQ